ncbi:MAG: 16S rRNA (uracil(1498)-N(3))-methyltransferase [Myxococcales bacterium]
MARLFIPGDRIEDDRASMTPEDERYLSRVLRLAPGDALEIFDGEGGRYPAVVQAKGELRIIGARVQDGAAPRQRLSLWQGLGKGDKMDFAVQKACELGAAEVVPLTCRRSVLRLEGERGLARLARWRKVAAEAARQCGRADVPAVADPASIDDLCRQARAGRVVLLHPGEPDAPALARSLSQAKLAAMPAVAIAVGPEGGFAPEEVLDVRRAGGLIAHLGRRTLRTETAAVVACAVWALSLGELG